MQGREIIVGVSGGIAAYKTAALVSRLVQAGAGVTRGHDRGGTRVCRSGDVCRAFRPARPRDGSFDDTRHPLGAHIDLAERAELFCVAPATANVLAKAAGGLADDLLEHSALVVHRSGASGSGDELRDVGKAGRPAQRRLNCKATASTSSGRTKAG